MQKKRQDPRGYDKLRSVTYSAGTTYQRFLYRFCREAALRGDQLFLEGKAWEKLMHEFRETGSSGQTTSLPESVPSPAGPAAGSMDWSWKAERRPAYCAAPAGR